MDIGKQIPEFKNYEEMAEFWDTHSLADYWEQTEPAEFEISEHARRRYCVQIDRDLLNLVQRMARVRGMSTESLINFILSPNDKKLIYSEIQLWMDKPWMKGREEVGR